MKNFKLVSKLRHFKRMSYVSFKNIPKGYGTIK